MGARAWVGMVMAVCALAMAPSAAVAAERLEPVLTLSDGSGAPDRPAAGANERGDVVVGWENEIRNGWAVEMARAQPGGSFSKPLRLNQRGVSARDPQVRVAPSGRVVVAWSQIRGDRVSTALRIAEPGGQFGPPVLVRGAGANGTGVVVQLDPLERVVVAWPSRAKGRSDLRVRVLSPQGQPLLSKLVFRSKRSDISHAPSILFDRSGSATFIWDQDVYDPDLRLVKKAVQAKRRRVPNRILSRRMSATGRLGAVRRLSPAALDCADFSTDSVASGAAAISFTCHRAKAKGDTKFNIYASQRSAGGGFSRPRKVAGPDDYASEVALIGQQAAVVWLKRRAKRYSVAGATLAGGRVTRRMSLSWGAGNPPRITGLADGASLITVQQGDGYPRWAIRDQAGQLGAWRPFAPGYVPAFAYAPLSPQRIFAVWIADAGTPNFVRGRFIVRD